ncbi:MAG: molecular chaperone HtpG [Bacteroidales bacterium]|nr:molecular chaperone HtpG [Bacteroidales bacterium]
MEGKLNVQTENIFPVIKKFLYSDHEIFLRELISNAVDATQKLKTLSTRGDFKGELGDLTIDVKIDSKKKTLTVSDRGIGMTADEVEKYINQIAFSGVTDFMEKYKDSMPGGTLDATSGVEPLIGHFGLGFYSAFMVSDKVEIFTKSWKDEPAQHWSCEGNPEFSMEEDKKADRGTDIVLHIADDCKEFLEEGTILQLLKKYCRFMPVAIRFGEESVWVDSETDCDKDGKPKRVEKKQPRIINDPDPAWKKSPSSLTDEDYKKFYHELFPMNFEEPLFQIHLNVDYPFNLTGILYFPKVRKTIDPNRNKIQLYCNQVFVTDQVEGVVPDYLMLLHGVLDSPDIPLNVSRSYLQSDSNVKKISQHISKKVADKLEEMSKKRQQDNETSSQQDGEDSKSRSLEVSKSPLEEKWDDIKIFVQYGMLTDEKFCERAMKFYLLKGVDGTYYTLDSYREKIKALQTDKDKTVCYLYASNAEEEHAYIEKAKAKGYDVLLMDSPLESHFINLLEQKMEKSRFVRVDSDTVEKLIPHDDSIPEKLSKEEKEKLQPIIEGEIDKQKFTVQLESLEESDAPMQVTQSEFMRRYREMAQTSGGGMGFYGELPESYNLVVNINHPLIGRVLNETDTEKQKELVHQLTDLALLGNGLLKGEALSRFLKRSVEMI